MQLRKHIQVIKTAINRQSTVELTVRSSLKYLASSSEQENYTVNVHKQPDARLASQTQTLHIHVTFHTSQKERRVQTKDLVLTGKIPPLASAFDCMLNGNKLYNSLSDAWQNPAVTGVTTTTKFFYTTHLHSAEILPNLHFWSYLPWSTYQTHQKYSLCDLALYMYNNH